LSKVILFFSFFLVLIGCNHPETNGTIEFNDSFTLVFEDRSILEDIAEITKNSSAANLTDDHLPQFTIEIGGKSYLITQKYLYYGSKQYPLSSIFFNHILELISDHISEITFHQETLEKNMQIQFQDLNIDVYLEKKYYDVLVRSLRSAVKAEYDRPISRPYPNIKINLNDFTLELVSQQTFLISIHDHILGYYKFNSNEIWKIIEGNYGAYLQRSGLFAMKSIKFSFDDQLYYEVDHTNNRMDIIIRCFDFKSEQVTHPDSATLDKLDHVTLLLENGESIIVYENDIWCYEEKYYKQNDIYNVIHWQLNAN